MRFRTISPGDLPPPLDAVADHRLKVQLCLASKRAMLLSVESAPVNAPPTATQPPPQQGVWHFLILNTKAVWPPTGLRPVAASASVLDLFSLSSFPLLGGSERFVLYGVDSIAAAALSRSSARGILPADIGLLLHGPRLLLDFSARPFDTIEFERMIVVANQVVEHLPKLESMR